MDSVRKANTSFALLVPLVWYAIVASRSISQWLHPGSIDLTDFNYLEGSPIDRVVFSILILVGLLVLTRRKVEWLGVLKRNKWIFLLFLYMLISISWSNFPEVACKRWIKAAGALVMALIVLTEPESLEAISRLLRRCFYVHLPLSIILIKYFRTLGVAWDYTGEAEMWVGVTTHKNVLGQVVMTSGICFVWDIIRNWGSKRIILVDFFFLSMALWLLKGSDTSSSATSTIVFLFGIVIMLALRFAKIDLENVRRYTLIGVALAAFLFLVLQFLLEAFTQGSLASLVAGASGRDPTFTGRRDLWDDILKIASHHSILGVGYGSFWIGDLANDLWNKYHWRPQQGHNGYLDVYVELGLIGIFLLIVAILCAYKNIMKTFATNLEYARFRMVFLTTLLLHNYTESSFLRGTHNLWFLLLLVAVDVPEIYHDKSGYSKRQ